MKFRELEKLLLENGWTFKNAKGSHYQYTHPVNPRKLTVPNHPGDISPILAKAILKQAGL